MDPKKDLAQKIQVTGKSAEGGLALGFGETDLQIQRHQDTSAQHWSGNEIRKTQSTNPNQKISGKIRSGKVKI